MIFCKDNKLLVLVQKILLCKEYKRLDLTIYSIFLVGNKKLNMKYFAFFTRFDFLYNRLTSTPFQDGCAHIVPACFGVFSKSNRQNPWGGIVYPGK